MANTYLSASSGDGHKPTLEIADILREHGADYCRERIVPGDQRKVMRDITVCRTPELGGHLDVCEAGCGYQAVFYNSCRNRHCPKCQGVSRARWLAGRLQRILPTHYFHVVLTLPSELAPLALRNKRVMYNLLFQAGSRAMMELAEGYDRLKAKVGFTAVLHTWSQDLLHHPHLHLVVTGGGLGEGGGGWITTPRNFLLPVKALSKILRGKFLEMLEQQYDQGNLRFSGSIQNLADPKAFKKLIKKLRRKKWWVYSKSPFNGAEQVYSYLSQYTHRVAIANGRLVSMEHGKVTFRARDNANPGKHRMVSLDVDEFIRRFLQHVLPKGFVRIRHYGLMAPKNVNTRLDLAKKLINQTRGGDADQTKDTTPDEPAAPKHWRQILMELTGIDLRTCPKCKNGRLVRRPIMKGEIMLCYEPAPIAA